jgi:hypothetical protein
MKENKPQNKRLGPFNFDPRIERILKEVLEKGTLNSRDRQELLSNYFPQAPKEPKFYGQNWPIYYEASRTEKLMVYRIIKDAVDALEIIDGYKDGRPSAKLKEILISLCIQEYSGLSSWRVESELKIAQQLNFLETVYKRSTLNKYLDNPEITKWLEELYQNIAIPLAEVEEVLAVDSTGISVAYGKKKWVEVREEFQLHRDYKKLHIICGTRSNIIFAAKVTHGTSHDSPPFKELLEKATAITKAKEVCGDPAYTNHENVTLISSKGMVPFLMPKKNFVIRNRGSSVWGKMVRLWHDNLPLFKLHYHQRSNVESCFSMIKRKYSFYTRAKTKVSQTNEILRKVVCLNAGILSESLLEMPEILRYKTF